MNFKGLFFSTILLACATPVAFVVSCGSSGSTKDDQIVETKMLSDFLNNNSNALSSLGTNVEINNFVEFNGNWRNLDEFVSDKYLGKYFKISSDFKNKLQENKNQIYKKIKRVVIQPKKNSTDLTILFYLNLSYTDLNLVSHVVSNALTTSFTYKNEITIPKDINVKQFDNTNALNDVWKKATSKTPDLNALKDILNRAFNLSSVDQELVAQAIVDKKINIYKNSSNEVAIEILQKGLDEGFIFKSLAQDIESWENVLWSGSLVK